MPLNYSKWDQLEVSDDSDIEGHPNVDHKSLVRWKQRDIHEKRHARNVKIAQLEADIACYEVLKPRVIQLVSDIREKGPPFFSQTVERLKTQPSPDRPPTSRDGDPTYDDMISQLLMRVWEDCKAAGADKDDPELGTKLADAVQTHVVGIEESIAQKKAELVEEVKEKNKKITSEDIKEGFESAYVPAKPAPEPLVKPKPTKKAAKATTTEYETLNPKGVAAASTSKAAAVAEAQDAENEADAEDDDDDDDDTETPKLTPALRQFSQIKLNSKNTAETFQASFEFIQSHPEIYVEGAVDALLVEAFSSQMKADKDKKMSRYALQCVHQGLLLQYCEKLGRDGVRMFFRKMITGDAVALKVFEEDVQKTYAHIVGRAKHYTDNPPKGSDKETIQLVAENAGEGATIHFNIPDGPPPQDLRLEGPGTEGMDIEEVRKALQLRWDLFSSFTPKLQEALKKESLDAINKVLADLEVEEAEDVVERLQMGGILNFSEPGVRDVTGKDGAAAAAGASE